MQYTPQKHAHQVLFYQQTNNQPKEPMISLMMKDQEETGH
jgi:hypothetical protein